jgi:hypothetical protein
MTAGDNHRARWDFFVSYTQADRAWAEWIAWILEEDGHKVLVQAWDFVPGGNWIQNMNAGTRDAARTIAVLSPDYLHSLYGGAEWQAAWAQDPEGTGRKLLTVRVRECDRPGLLAGVVSTDLFGIPETAARGRLQAMVAAAITGRAKPMVAPVFPGGGAGRAIPREPRFPGALPRIWKVPARNPNFTGRGHELAQLATGLAADSMVTVQAVRGMGGVGKTQLATEYAHLHATNYDLVWWIAAEEPAAIPDQFTALAARLGLDVAADPEALAAQVNEALREAANWLMIFDNADTVEDLAPWLPSGPVPGGTLGHVITTTRRGGFAALGRVLDLNVIGLDDGVTLLRRRVPNLDQRTGEQITEELGRLPLALEQAAAYLDQTGMPAAEYLDLLRRRAADLYARGQVTGRPDTIATLWDLNLDTIGGAHAATVELLSLCAWMAPEPVPLDLFTSHTGQLPGLLKSVAADPLAFTDTVAVAVDYSLAKRTQAGLQLHRLVQAAIRALPSPAPVPRDAPPARSDDPLPIRSDDPLPLVLGLLRADAPQRIAGVPEDWPRWAVLLPHVLAATSYLDGAARRPGQQAMTDGAWLLHRAGIYLQVHGRLAEARELINAALVIYEATHGPDYPEVAGCLNMLAAILRGLGDAAGARPLAERALAIIEAAYGPDHPNVATSLNTLAAILRSLGDAAAAKLMQERALIITEAAYGPDDPNVASCLNTLAAILRSLGDAAGARPLAERALAIIEAAYGPDHPDVAIYLNTLAAILRYLGDAAGARPLAERALAITEAAYGPDHLQVTIELNNLAAILRSLGDAAGARPLAERALAITEATYGLGHPNVAIRLNNLAAILRDLDDAAGARPLAERALAITEAAYGPGHSRTAVDLNNLAATLRSLGDAAGARPLAERALAITEAAYGPGHSRTAVDLNNLAAILQDLGDTAGAKLLQERALAITQTR